MVAEKSYKCGEKRKQIPSLVSVMTKKTRVMNSTSFEIESFKYHINIVFDKLRFELKETEKFFENAINDIDYENQKNSMIYWKPPPPPEKKEETK